MYLTNVTNEMIIGDGSCSVVSLSAPSPFADVSDEGVLVHRHDFQPFLHSTATSCYFLGRWYLQKSQKVSFLDRKNLLKKSIYLKVGPHLGK